MALENPDIADSPRPGLPWPARASSALIQIVVFVCAVLSMGWWLRLPQPYALVESVPGMDGKSDRATADEEGVKIGAIFQTFDGTPSDIPGSWPGFRGLDGDAVVQEAAPLLASWPADGPRQLWSITLGEGHSGAAVANGRVYILDYDEENRRDSLRCFSLGDGLEIWRRSYDVHVKRNHGMSRTIPTLAHGFAVSIGPKCHVMCVDSDTGDFRWGIGMVEEYGTKIPGWYAGQCPYVDGNEVILAPAGTNVLAMGVDIATGEVKWTTPNPQKWNMSHASIVPMELGGRRMYVYAAVGGVAGIAADGADRGKVLWETSAFSPSVVAPSPVVLGDGRIFLTAGYGAGGAMIQVKPDGDSFTVDVLYKHRARDGLACEQQTPIFYKGLLYGIMPKDGGALRNQFVCYHPDGELVWASGKEARFGIGPFLVADGKILILDDDGKLTMIEASTTGYRQLAEAQVLDGVDSWAPPALVGGRLLVRDSREMVCLAIGKEIAE